MVFKANFEAIDVAAGDISTGANGIESKLNDMDSQLQPLQADWTGSASESYQQAKARWEKALTEMKELLVNIGRATTEGNQDYQQTEKANANRFE